VAKGANSRKHVRRLTRAVGRSDARILEWSWALLVGVGVRHRVTGYPVDDLGAALPFGKHLVLRPVPCLGDTLHRCLPAVRALTISV